MPVGWSLLLDGVVERVALSDTGTDTGTGTGTGSGDRAEPLVHRRGRYLRPAHGGAG